MKRIFTLLCFILPAIAQSQTSADYAVQLTAEVQKSPAQITLKWKALTGNGTYRIFRKAKGATSWGVSIASPAAAATSYVDNNVSPGTTYEYFVSKTDEPSNGYILAGIEAEALHTKGALLLLVDSTFVDSCAPQISQLMKDISNDGWAVSKKEYNRNAPVTTIKNDIVAAYQANNNLKAIYILGHLAVPYSGDYNTTNLLPPDGHTDHAGAWPADVFYGEVNGTWTDAVNNQLGTRPANKNAPGDGKYDQTEIPGDVELQIGRIDFANMPAIPRTEIEMMRNYLDKAHNFKTGNLTTVKRALIDDNFGKMNGEGFAATAYRLSPIVHSDSIKVLDFVPSLKSSSFMWGFGCGGGSFTTCSGVATTDSFKTGNINAIFTVMFGSYFGDWNVQNNLLRAPLCAEEPALTSCWSGRPHWYFHHMALGENIGYSTLLTHNNINMYQNKVSFYPHYIHQALLGDPTLRTEYIKPASAVGLSGDSTTGAVVNWTASPEAGVAGYYVYRASSEYGEYKLRSGLVAGTTFTDSFGNAGTYWYMVRPSKLQSTPSGTYYNLGLGATQSGTFKYPKYEVGIHHIDPPFSVSIAPNPARDYTQLSISSHAQAQLNISITDVQGKTLYNTSMKLRAGQNIQMLDMSSYAPGLYLVQLQSAQQNTTIKLSKTH